MLNTKPHPLIVELSCATRLSIAKQLVDIHIKELEKSFKNLNNSQIIVIDSLSSLSEELMRMNIETEVHIQKHKVPFWANDWRRKRC